ncbi:preprotein translocase subunit SecF [Achromatium sp. WMS3]|nr:preprotein translocase subunit SecF [Achromatium sp. WMS3]
MKIFNKVSNIDFLSLRHSMAAMSVFLIVLCFGSFFIYGFTFGLDFTGGTLIEVHYDKDVADLSTVRQLLAKAGFADASVQRFGTPKDVLIRLGISDSETSGITLSTRAFEALQQAAKVEKRRVEYVGPQVGKELVEEGGLAILYSLIGILMYVAMRFEYRFAVGAITAIIHDVIATLGIFSAFQIEFDLTVLAAVLAVIGYSLNDTIVVFDRIRENFRKLRKGTVIEIINISLNETFSRTLITSGTTLLTVLALYNFGGEIIRGFSLALLVGIIVGTYSSIYIASAAVVALGIDRSNLIAPKKELQLDEMP